MVTNKNITKARTYFVIQEDGEFIINDYDDYDTTTDDISLAYQYKSLHNAFRSCASDITRIVFEIGATIYDDYSTSSDVIKVYTCSEIQQYNKEYDDKELEEKRLNRLKEQERDEAYFRKVNKEHEEERQYLKVKYETELKPKVISLQDEFKSEHYLNLRSLYITEKTDAHILFYGNFDVDEHNYYKILFQVYSVIKLLLDNHLKFALDSTKIYVLKEDIEDIRELLIINEYLKK